MPTPWYEESTATALARPRPALRRGNSWVTRPDAPGNTRSTCGRCACRGTHAFQSGVPRGSPHGPVFHKLRIWRYSRNARVRKSLRMERQIWAVDLPGHVDPARLHYAFAWAILRAEVRKASRMAGRCDIFTNRHSGIDHAISCRGLWVPAGAALPDASGGHTRCHQRESRAWLRRT